MADKVEGFNESGVISVKDEVTVYLRNVVHVSPEVSYKLVEDDDTGQVFKITVSDQAGVSKGSVSLTIVPVPNGSLVSLSPYAPCKGSEQTLRLSTVDSFLRQAVADTPFETRQHFEVFMHTTYVTDGFSQVEPLISNVLDQVGVAMLKARHEYEPDKSTRQARSSVTFSEAQPLSYDKIV